MDEVFLTMYIIGVLMAIFATVFVLFVKRK